MSRLIKGVNDFQSWCTKNKSTMIEEWDYNKNDISPSDICYGSAKKVFWVGKECGHSYIASLNKRTSDGTGCPYCSTSHAKLLKGFNDLATTNPEVAELWDYESNGELTPSDVMKGQHLKVYWKGKCGHTWQASVYHVVAGRGCPICNRESKTSFPEQAVYYFVKKYYKDAINGDRHLGRELDIYIPSEKTAIEYDGQRWHQNKERDESKNKLCEMNGIRLIRIRERACWFWPETDFLKLIACESANEMELANAILNVFAILKGPVFVDISINKEKVNIYNQYIKKKKDNSLLFTNPSLASEWNSTKNIGLTPDMVSYSSEKKVWWICKNGHEWEATVASRNNMHSGCPYCSGKLLKGFNDLETCHPELLAFWNYELNQGITPADVSCKSNRKVWWHCSECGHDYEMSIYNKVNHPHSCPYCSHRIINQGVTDLKTLEPNIAKEWDYEKNGILQPDEVTKYSMKKVWWRCPNGHSYQATVSNRTQGRGCPFCSGRKVITGVNDFATLHPELLEEWDYSKNTKSPSLYSEHQRVYVWWKGKCGHSWKQTIEARSYGHGCPICGGAARKRVLNIDTNTVFNSLKEAAKSCGLSQGDTISLCCKGKVKTAGGYHWRFIEK